uniref:ATP synthase F0 subunit 8 n=1 Tax=Cyphoderus albinus TaxID=1499079 RepID=A0A6H0EVV1_9HEXA|nr:ATP synthase F0 subunit 8 [Cyphoderus albinus]QIT06448.1 ATP synthase F0 subunit 8 [Cyphoderus albinus]
MPQMYPLLWMILFAIFTLLFVIFLTKMFFYNMNSKANTSETLMKKSLINKTWLW